MLIAEDPRSYVYRILAYVQAKKTKARTNYNVLLLFDGVPKHSKKHCIRDKPTTIDEFTERAKDVRREQLYDQKTLIPQVTSGLAPSSATILSALAASVISVASSTDPSVLQTLLGLNQSQ